MSKKESPHINVLRRQDKLNKLATKKIRVAGGKVEKYEAGAPAQDIEKVVAAAAAAERRHRDAMNAASVASAEPGHMIRNRGVFLGKYAPKGLGKVFNVFAAPNDMPTRDKYLAMVKKVSELKDWHGHNGASYQSDQELYAALENGDYDGEWVIPPGELLNGKDAHGNPVQPDNLYAHRNKGSLKGTFQTFYTLDSWYWSSTMHPERPQEVSDVHFASGNSSWSHKNGFQISCRPVRLEPIP